MLTINVLCVGKIKEKFFKDAIDEYSKRLSRYCKLNIIEVSDEKIPEMAGEKIEEKVKEKECDNLINHLKKDSYVIALDLKGKEYDSVELSKHIEQLSINTSNITFIIGGSLGLNNKILSLDSYISGITKNLVKEKLKKRKITYDISDYENVIEYSQLQKMFPAEREEISKVESILENFKEIDLKIFKLFYYQDMSIKDIAKEERTSEFNVKTRLYRIRKKIKKELNDGGYYGK